MPEIDKELFRESLKRALKDAEKMPAAETPTLGLDSGHADSTSISPELLAILGAGADAGSTYVGLKQGHREDNAMFGGLGNRPAVTAGAVLGTSLASVLVSRLLAKKFPKLADSILVNQGAHQLGLGVENVTDKRGTKHVSKLLAESVKRETH
jgi:hypothetical protein